MSFDTAPMRGAIQIREQYSHVIDAQDKTYFN